MPRRRLPRPCIDCGTPTLNTRCPKHKGQHKRATEHPQHTDPQDRKARKRAVQRHVQQYGWVCPGAPDLNHDPHPTRDLTADHLVPVSQGGTWRDGLRILCRKANASRGGTNRPPQGAPPTT